MRKKFYITTPIFYPNARLHLGHAYSTTLADIVARYHRLRGDEVYFLTGADENTEKVARAARNAEQEPQTYLDSVVASFKRLFSELTISSDQFIRTSDEETHWPGAMELWKRIAARGDLEKRSYTGLYCVGHEAFITEKELSYGKCPEHDEAPQKLSEENYFFKLSKYTAEIKKRIESGEFAIVPQTRRNEILALLERGLEDVSFSRPADKVTLGIPVPGDPSQKMYVWCDALASYISALGFGGKDGTLFKKFWPADVHVIGKDILRFHAAIWPAMLLSAGLPLPRTIFVHGFITSGGRKMSKTLGNVIDPELLIKEYGAEAVRFYLARHISTFEDGDVTLESFKAAYNADLANGIGNLVSRIMRMAEHTNIPKQTNERKDTDDAHSFPQRFTDALDSYNIQAAATLISEAVASLDRRIQETQPFKLIKENPEKGNALIAELVNGLASVPRMLAPILPKTADIILTLIKENRMPATPLFPRR